VSAVFWHFSDQIQIKKCQQQYCNNEDGCSPQDIPSTYCRIEKITDVPDEKKPRPSIK
jgi:hypothetical protein